MELSRPCCISMQHVGSLGRWDQEVRSCFYVCCWLKWFVRVWELCLSAWTIVCTVMIVLWLERFGGPNAILVHFEVQCSRKSRRCSPCWCPSKGMGMLQACQFTCNNIACPNAHYLENLQVEVIEPIHSLSAPKVHHGELSRGWWWGRAVVGGGTWYRDLFWSKYRYGNLMNPPM